MINLSELIKYPKADLHNHLGTGMRYASFVAWAGYEIPDYPPKDKTDPIPFTETIRSYVHSRNASPKDTLAILQLAIQDAIADGVTILHGSIDASMSIPCQGIAELIQTVNQVKEKFASKIEFHPSIDFGPVSSNLLIESKAFEILSSGAFEGVTAYGKDAICLTQTYRSLFKIADNLKLTKKCLANSNVKADGILKMIETYNLNEIQLGVNIAKDKDAMKEVARNNIRFNLCPAGDIYFGVIDDYKSHPIRKMVDAGVNVSISSDCLLFFNKSISEQCKNLVDEGLFSENEIKLLLDKSLS